MSSYSSSEVLSLSFLAEISAFLDKQKRCVILPQWQPDRGRNPVKYPVSSSLRHKGKVLDLDVEREVVTLLGITGEPIGSLSWDFVIDQIMAYRKPPVPKEVRSEPRISLAFRVRYHTPEGHRYESRAGGIGGGGLFIESLCPLPVGTKLVMEFSLPENGSDWLPAKGIVAWVCPKADQYTFSPGMGVRFSDITPDTRDRILALVKSVHGTGQAA
jgi:type IV pilus assembly protein PilZ